LRKALKKLPHRAKDRAISRKRSHSKNKDWKVYVVTVERFSNKRLIFKFI
jgi:hypothetical protein